MYRMRMALAGLLLALVLLGSVLGGPALAQSGVTNLSNLVLSGDLTVGDDLTLTDDASVSGDLSVTGALDVDGASTLNSTLDVDGAVSSGTGAITITDNVLVDGAADAEQLVVQGYTTQTNSSLVVEQSDGTDVLTVANDGALDVDGATTLNSSLDVDGNVSSGTGLITVTDGINQAITSYENLGSLPTVASANITYATTTDLFTVGDGEVWFVHDVLVNVTANYDCTGDDCTLGIGDGNDDNGLADLIDAELQAADTEGTGFAAGWQGQLADTKGAFLADGNFVYAPSGAAEGIDATVGGTDPAAGAATIYIVYTRIQ